jgi:DNA polymerase III alpha subunit (gram-positive type)
MAKHETYVSTDVETDGPIPGPNSMLSFASVAFDETGTELGSFTRNLETLPGAAGNPSTMAWWAENKAAWDACRTSLVPPERAMVDYVSWVTALPGKPVFVAYPAGFDFLFMYWYMVRFAGQSPFSHSALDIKTYAMALLRKPYRESTKRNMPKRWFPAVPHTHVALDDAREQGLLFINMLNENLDTFRSQPER